MGPVKPPAVFAFLGDSLTTGRLSADWVPRLEAELRQQPEAVGPVRTLNLGKGSQTSVWALTQVPLLVALKPSHVMLGGFEHNDCVDSGGGPAVSRADHIQNLKDIIDGLRAGIPDVDITLQTMSTISASIVGLRPNLADYVADTIATAAVKDVRLLDNYAGWPDPLDPLLTAGRILMSYDPPAGFDGWDAAATFDPAAKHADVTLSAGNLTMTSSNTHRGVRGTVSKSAGKHYCEFHVSGAAGTTVGLETAAAALNNFVGGDANGYGYYGVTGEMFNAGVAGPTYATYGAAVIGLACDFDADKLWVHKNGIYQTGDPAAGTGGLAIAPGTYFPAASASAGGIVSAMFGHIHGDGLHPIAAGAVDVYLYPNILAWARARMTEHFAD